MAKATTLPEKTLVVEDHELVRSFLASWLTERGHNVRPCGQEDLDQLDHLGRHDLVILDLCLGDSDGLEVLQRLASHKFAGDIVLISAFSDSVIETARNIGMDFGLKIVGALRKPLMLEQLDAVLDTPKRPRPHYPHKPVEVITLAMALASRRIAFHYQPILDARTLDILSIEMLARLVSPSGLVGSVYPVLPGASTEDLHNLARCAISATDDLRKVLIASGLGPLPVSINVPSSFVRRCHLFSALEEAALPVTLEITEQDPFEDFNEARLTATSAILKGVRLSLDDFGVANSNVDRFMRMPFNELKVDRSFVSGCADDPFRAAVCRSAAELARLRGAVSVAEGVETEADFDYLRSIGFDRVQGYFFSRPLPTAALVSWISSHRGLAWPPAAVARGAAAAREIAL